MVYFVYINNERCGVCISMEVAKRSVAITFSRLGFATEWAVSNSETGQIARDAKNGDKIVIEPVPFIVNADHL